MKLSNAIGPWKMGPTGTNQSKEQVSVILMKATEAGAILLLDKDRQMN